VHDEHGYCDGKHAETVARRELRLAGNTYTVTIRKPYYVAHDNNYVCEWVLCDGRGEIVAWEKMYGVDSVDALLAVFLVIGERLNAESSEFTHLGLPGTGFLRLVPNSENHERLWRLPR
jgi:hypothetical protein